MKDKHINIPGHSLIQKQLLPAVHEGLHIDRAATTRLIWLKAVIYALLASLTYSCIYQAANIFLLAMAYIVYGFITVLLGFNFAHDFSHNTVFRSRVANNLCFSFIYALLGAHAEAWKHRHVHAHHYAPNVRDYDTDLQITCLIRVEPGSRLRWFHRYQYLYAPLAYTTYSLYWVFIKDFVIYLRPNEAPKDNKAIYHLSFWLQKGFYLTYLLILPAHFTAHPPGAVFTAFLCMHLMQSLFLLFTFFMTHHVERTEYFEADEAGYIRTSWLNNQIRSSNDFHPFSRTANFIFGGFNNHIAHHLFPHIHHVHYPALNRILYKVLLDHRIQPNVTSYFGGVRAHLRHLRRMGSAQG